MAMQRAGNGRIEPEPADAKAVSRLADPVVRRVLPDFGQGGRAIRHIPDPAIVRALDVQGGLGSSFPPRSALLSPFNNP